MRIAVTVQAGDRALDVVIDGASGTALGAVADELCAAVGVRRGTPLWCGDVRLDPAAPIGVPPLMHGAVVWAGGPPAGEVRGSDGRQLGVVCGPDSGLLVTVPGGRSQLGRAADVALRLDDPDVSRRHAELTVSQDGVAVVDLGSVNGTTVGGCVVADGPATLGPGELLQVGESVLVLTTDSAGRACTDPDGEGRLRVNSPPRLRGPRRWARVEFPVEPTPPHPVRFQPALLAVPLLIAVPAALWWGPTMLVFLVLSPLMMLANYVGDRSGNRRSHRRALAGYAADLTRAQEALVAALSAEARVRREEFVDPAEAAAAAVGPGARLWEGSCDASPIVRLGLADLPAHTAAVRADGREQDRPVVAQVPVAVALDECGVLGVAGPRARVLEVARAILLQLAVTHSPRDLELAVLCGDGAAADWAWARWLPHLRRPGDACAPRAPARVEVADLLGLLDARSAQARAHARPSSGRPSVVVVLDDPRGLRGLPGVARLLAEGPAVGLLTICLAAQLGELPAECGATAAVHGESGTRLEVRVAGADVVPSARAGLVGAARAESVARALAPLRDATPALDGAALPGELRLLDLLELPDPSGPVGELATALAGRWAKAAGRPRALVGVGPEGPVTIDLVQDGPHGLVAGTTGSGKSEFLQTLVAALAAAHPPDELGFLLVDYKGGAAFAECSELPHTLGTVTDLDARLTARALRSMEAELRRRERHLATARCADLAAYVAAGRPGGALGRLLVVVDEFAALAAELPEFVDGLVDVARRGRSLGVHLVLATQRPAGVVTAEMRANTALRIALRVTDPDSSRDVVDCPDAAAIPAGVPGRGYLRTAAGPATPFQTARVGGPGAAPRAVGVTVAPWAWAAPHLAPAAEPSPNRAGSDLAALAVAAREAATAAGTVPPSPPWLPPLPTLVASADLVPGPETLAFGLLDLPARQSYGVLSLDLADGGHWAVVGGPRTGRSTALRTLAAQAARRPEGDVHLYGLDFGGGGLHGLGALPACGTLAGRADPARAARLVQRLLTEVTRRQDVLAARGFGSVAEHRAAGAAAAGDEEPLPWMLLLVDGWEAVVAAFTELDPASGIDPVLRLLADGPAAGLHVVVTGGRDLLTGRVSSLVAHRAVLALPDRADFGLAGITARETPDNLPAGRALIVTPRGVDEAQLAVPGLVADAPAQAADLAALAQSAPKRAGTARPLRVEPLPDALPWAEAAAICEGNERDPGWLLLGLGGDDLDAVGLDPGTDGPVVLVTGQPRTGRSTALVAIARWYAAQSVPVVAVAPRKSPLREVAGSPDGPPGPWVTDGRDPAEFRALLGAARALAGGARGPVAVLVDDVGALSDTATGDLLGDLAAAPDGATVVVAGEVEAFTSAYRGVAAVARRSRCALVLGRCGPAESDLAGTPLPRGAGGPPGRGLLVAHGHLTHLQVPQP